MATEEKSVFEYQNFRLFLLDKFNLMKSRDPKFSHRYLAKLARIRSPSFLQAVMKGKANLSVDTIDRVSEALQLSKEEQYYFKNLVLLEQAKSIEERFIYSQQLIRSKSFGRLQPISDSIYSYFSHWYYAAIKELVGLHGFRNEPQWISSRFGGLITPEEAAQAINDLLSLGMLTISPTGALEEAQDIVTTQDEVSSATVTKYHEEFIQLGSESIRRHNRNRREISATTFRISERSFPKLKEMLQRFRKELVETIAFESAAGAIYQLNMQLFPLAPFIGDLEKARKN